MFHNPTNDKSDELAKLMLDSQDIPGDIHPYILADAMEKSAGVLERKWKRHVRKNLNWEIYLKCDLTGNGKEANATSDGDITDDDMTDNDTTDNGTTSDDDESDDDMSDDDSSDYDTSDDNTSDYDTSDDDTSDDDSSDGYMTVDDTTDDATDDATDFDERDYDTTNTSDDDMDSDLRFLVNFNKYSLLRGDRNFDLDPALIAMLPESKVKLQMAENDRQQSALGPNGDTENANQAIGMVANLIDANLGAGDAGISNANDAGIRNVVDAGIRNAGDLTNTNLGDAVDSVIRDAGDATIRDASDVNIIDTGDVAIREAGNSAIREAVDAAIGEADNSQIKEAGDSAIREADNLAIISNAVDTAIRDAGDAAIRDADDAAIRDAGDVAMRDASDVAMRDASDVAMRDASHAGIRDAGDATNMDTGEATNRNSVDVAIGDAGDVGVVDLNLNNIERAPLSQDEPLPERRRRYSQHRTVRRNPQQPPPIIPTQDFGILENRRARTIWPQPTIEITRQLPDFEPTTVVAELVVAVEPKQKESICAVEPNLNIQVDHSEVNLNHVNVPLEVNLNHVNVPLEVNYESTQTAATVPPPSDIHMEMRHPIEFNENIAVNAIDIGNEEQTVTSHQWKMLKEINVIHDVVIGKDANDILRGRNAEESARAFETVAILNHLRVFKLTKDENLRITGIDLQDDSDDDRRSDR